MDENKLSFHLEALIRNEDTVSDFEGPLSLILELLRKNKIAIRDIRISDILDQYLEYLDRMQSMDLEIASEFVQMASYLLLIKSKMLLTGDRNEISELDQLIESLEKLQARDSFETLRTVLPELEHRSRTGLLYFSKNPEALPKGSGDVDFGFDGLDLLTAMLYVSLRGGGKAAAERVVRPEIPHRVLYSVREKSREIIGRLKQGPENLKDLFAACASRTESVAAFLSILELCSFGSIGISRRGNDYMLELISDDIESIMEKITD